MVRGCHHRSSHLPSQHHLQLQEQAVFPQKLPSFAKVFPNTSQHITKQFISPVSKWFLLPVTAWTRKILKKTINVDFPHQELNYCETMTIIMQWKNLSPLSLHHNWKIWCIQCTFGIPGHRDMQRKQHGSKYSFSGGLSLNMLCCLAQQSQTVSKKKKTLHHHTDSAGREDKRCHTKSLASNITSIPYGNNNRK